VSSTHGPDSRRGRSRVGWPATRELPVLATRSKDPLKELYQGRWKQLPTLQKVGVVTVLSVLSVFAWLFFVSPLMHTEGWKYLAETAFTAGGFFVCLLIFRMVLFRVIRHSRKG